MATQTDTLETIVQLVGAQRYMARTRSITDRVNKAAKAQDAWNTKMMGFTRAAQGMDRAGTRMLIMGAAVTGILATMVKRASDVEEQMNLFEVVFGKNARDVERWADRFADATGRSRFALMEFAGDFQALLVPMGLTQDEAVGMSEALAELVVDVASFKNLVEADVARKFISGLAGMHRAMFDLGIIVTQDEIKLELLRLGVEKTWLEVSAAEKVQARFNIIMGRAGALGAMADAEKTAGSLENRLKRLTSEYQDMALTIGNNLMPVAQALTTTTIELIDGFNDLPKWLQKTITFLVGTGGLILLFGGLTLKMVALGIQLVANIGLAKTYVGALTAEATAAHGAAVANEHLAGARAAAAVAGAAAGVGGAAAGIGALAGGVGAAGALALPAAGAAAGAAAGVLPMLGLVIAVLAAAGTVHLVSLVKNLLGHVEEEVVPEVGGRIGGAIVGALTAEERKAAEVKIQKDLNHELALMIAMEKAGAATAEEVHAKRAAVLDDLKAKWNEMTDAERESTEGRKLQLDAWELQAEQVSLVAQQAERIADASARWQDFLKASAETWERIGAFGFWADTMDDLAGSYWDQADALAAQGQNLEAIQAQNEALAIQEEKRTREIERQQGLTSANVDLWRAFVELQEARGVRGLRLRGAKRGLAGAEAGQAAQLFAMGRGAQDPQERARFFAAAMRSQAGALTTFQGSRGGGGIIVNVQGDAGQAFRWNAKLQNTQGGQFIRATTGTNGYPAPG